MAECDLLILHFFTVSSTVLKFNNSNKLLTTETTYVSNNTYS